MFLYCVTAYLDSLPGMFLPQIHSVGVDGDPLPRSNDTTPDYAHSLEVEHELCTRCLVLLYTSRRRYTFRRPLGSEFSHHIANLSLSRRSKRKLFCGVPRLKRQLLLLHNILPSLLICAKMTHNNKTCVALVLSDSLASPIPHQHVTSGTSGHAGQRKWFRKRQPKNRTKQGCMADIESGLLSPYICRRNWWIPMRRQY